MISFILFQEKKQLICFFFCDPILGEAAFFQQIQHVLREESGSFFSLSGKQPADPVVVQQQKRLIIALLVLAICRVVEIQQSAWHENKQKQQDDHSKEEKRHQIRAVFQSDRDTVMGGVGCLPALLHPGCLVR